MIDAKKYRTFSIGDTVGMYADRETAQFTHNGALVGHKLKLNPSVLLIPAVCLTC